MSLENYNSKHSAPTWQNPILRKQRKTRATQPNSLLLNWTRKAPRAMYPTYRVPFKMLSTGVLAQYQNLLSWKGPPYPRDLTDPAGRVTRLKELGKEFAEPWRSAGLSVPDDAVLSIDSGSSWDPRSVQDMWDTKAGRGWGRVTLARDAAHTMLPHRGQGLNHGLQDAKDLVDALSSGKSWDLVVEEYEKEMVARAGLEVEVSGKQAAMAHDWNRLMQSPMFKMGANKSA